MAKKISDLTAISGGVFASADVFEISVDTGGGGFVSRKITGSEMLASIPTSSSLATADQTITTAERVVTLNGDLSTDKVIFKNASATELMTIAGDGTTAIGDSVTSTVNLAVGRTTTGQAIKASNTATSGNNIAINARCTGAGAESVALRLDASNATTNQAIKIVSGDIKYAQATQVIELNGSLSTDNVTFKNAGGTALLNILGDGSVYGYGRGGISTNIAYGNNVFNDTLTSNNNIGIGNDVLNNLTNGQSLIGIGHNALENLVNGNNYTIGLGRSAGSKIASGSDCDRAFNSLFIGYDTRPSGNVQSNQIVIGHQAVGNGANTATLGNSSIVGTFLQGAVVVGEYTVATLPTASTYQAGIIMVSDETGGYTQAFSDGTNWRRVQDRAIVS